MYVLDTNTLIYFFKGMGNVADKLLSTPPNQIIIPSIVIYELEYGIAKSKSPKKRITQLEQLCSLVSIAPFTSTEAQQAAAITAKMEKLGTPIGPYDTLIAGTTIAAKGILVTNNTKEFSRIPKIKLENCFKP